MSRRLELLIVFVFALVVSFLTGWAMMPGNTPLHDWVVPAIGSSAATLLRYVVNGLAVAAVFQVVTSWSRHRKMVASSSSKQD